MDQESISKIVEHLVTENIKANTDFISNEISKGIRWEDGWEKTVSRIALNAVNVSCRLSVQIVISLLIKEGLLTIPPDALLPQLELIRGGMDPAENQESHPE